MAFLRQFIFLIRESMREWQEDGAANLAAALAYHTIFSLSPLLIMIALVIGAVLDRNTVSEELINDVEVAIGPEAAETLQDILENEESQPPDVRANLIGAVVWFSVVIWGASGLFSQLQKALNRIWEVKARPGRSPLFFIKDRFISIIVVIFVSVLLLIVTLANAGLNLLIRNFDEIAQLSYIIRPTQFLVTTLMLTVLFAMIYKVLPDVIIHWRDLWVGAAVTGFLFFIGQFVVGLYLSISNVGSVFGAASSLTVILVWVYYSAQILLFGAEFTEVWARYHGARIRPDPVAVWVNEIQARREAEMAGLAFNPEDTAEIIRPTRARSSNGLGRLLRRSPPT